MDTLNAQPMYHSPAIHAVYARVRQLAHLASDAVDHLIDAVDLLDRIPALYHAIHRDRLVPPHPLTHQPH
ncbi:hypothetical protein ACWGJW_13250 [Streptomyces nigrescens]